MVVMYTREAYTEQKCSAIFPFKEQFSNIDAILLRILPVSERGLSVSPDHVCYITVLALLKGR